MKRKMAIIAVCFLLTVFTGCGAKDNNQTVVSEEDAADSDVQSLRPDKDDIVISVTGANEVSESYGSIGALMEDTDTVVYAEALTYGYGFGDGSMYTVVTARVLNGLYGDLKAGDEFTALRTGGHMKLETYIRMGDYFPESFREQVRNSSEFTEIPEEGKTIFVSYFPDGEVDTKSGDKSVFFLRESGETYHNYYRVGSYQGEYVELSTGEFKVPGVETYEEVDNAALSGDTKESGLSSCIISRDEIVSQIQQYMKGKNRILIN